MPRVLMVAFHFPPMAGSSGVQRTLRFVQHLPGLGWEPIVLSVHPRAHEKTSEDLMPDIPPGIHVERAFALDTQRHLSLGGRYIAAMARPDRWISWTLGAIPAGLKLVRRFRPDVIWSTYPIATAHIIGHALHRRTGLPWVADFRDPMAQVDYPSDPRTHAAFSRIENKTFSDAACCTVTTPGTARLYRERFPASANRIHLLENGYDEESFAGVAATGEPLVPGKLTLLHSGIVYPSERDPRAFLKAIALLRQRAPAWANRLHLRLRASSNEDFLREEIARVRLGDCVEIAPPLPYREALAEMVRADALVIMQAANCNDQIPAKLYEYLRARRPILGLTDPAGDTWHALQAAGIDTLAPLDDTDAIVTRLEAFVTALVENGAPLASAQTVQSCSRLGRTKAFADILSSARNLT